MANEKQLDKIADSILSLNNEKGGLTEEKLFQRKGGEN